MAAKFSVASCFFLLLLSVIICCALADTTVPAFSPFVTVVGRAVPDTSTGAVNFDWEGVSFQVTLGFPFTYLIVNIQDNCPGTPVGGGSRWAVEMTTSNPNVAAPQHRISTFLTGPHVSSYYMFSDPSGACDPGCSYSGNTTFRLTRLTESRLTGCTSEAGLYVQSFISDGTFLAPPPPRTRRLEFVGDSISAGDLNDGGLLVGGSVDTVCANGAVNNDILYSSGGILCSETLGFNADCMYTAWGGIRLGDSEQGWGMMSLYPSLFSSAGEGSEYGEFNFTSFAADAVVINLGTNDQPASPATFWQQSYVQFAVDIVENFYQNHNITLFLAFGPMTTMYEPYVANITSTLMAQGYNAYLLDLTLSHPLTGCFGHPSYADNLEIAAKAKSQIGDVLGWD